MLKTIAAVALVCVCAFLGTLPFAAQADAQSSLAQICKGYTGDPTDSRQFLQSDFANGKLTAASMNTYLDRKVLCPSACWDVSMRLSIGGGLLSGGYLQIDTTGINKCKNPQPQASSVQSVYTKLPQPNDVRNCDNGRGVHSITVSSEQANGAILMVGGSKVPDIFRQEQNIEAKSRCDPNVTQTIASLSTGNFSQGFSQLSGMQQPSAPGVSADTTSLSAIQKAQQALQNGDVAGGLTSLGATPAQVQSVMQGDPQDAKKLLEDIAAGNTASAQQVAAKLNLNPNLSSDVFQLNATQSVGNATGAIVGTPTGDNSNAQTGDTTFGGGQTEPPPQSACGVDGIAGQIMAAESACGRFNYNPLSTVQGPYQYLCSTWQTDTAAVGMSQYSDCGYRNNTAIATQVVNARYDQYQQQYGDQCAAAGQTWTSCAYAIHVFGQGGFQNILNAEQADPNASAFSLCGSAISSAACSNNASIFRNGGTVSGLFSELDRRLGAGAGAGIATGGIVAAASPVYPVATSPFSGFLGQSYGFTPFTSSVGAPFASFLSPVSPGLSLGFNAPQYSPVQSQNPVPAIQYPQNVNSTQVPTIQPSASIILAQPEQVAVGKTVLVSWSTVGMSSCTVSGNGAPIAQSNSGTKSLTITSTGTTTFVLICTSANATVSQQTAAVVAH